MTLVLCITASITAAGFVGGAAVLTWCWSLCLVPAMGSQWKMSLPEHFPEWEVVRQQDLALTFTLTRLV